jgi:hypothetical protein
VTAFLAVPQGDRIHLLSDGACYSPDGTVLIIGRKVVELPECSAAYVTRGDMRVHHTLPALMACKSFAELIERATEQLPRMRDAWRPFIGDAWEILIAGISDGGPALFFYEAHGDGVLRQIQDDYLAAGPQPTTETQLAIGVRPPENMADFDPMKHGIAAMEAFRRTPDGELYGVGGIVSHTEIARGRVATRVIHVWPDRVGEKITPHAH